MKTTPYWTDDYPRPSDLPVAAEYESCFPNCGETLDGIRIRLLANGRYVKLRKLGQAAVGEVWQALDRCRRTPFYLTVRREVHEVRPADDTLRTSDSNS